MSDENLLFIPMSLRALVVGKLPDEPWRADILDDYSRLADCALGDFVPSQLTVSRDMAKGVHLHWSLPDALTRGEQQDEGGQTVFPAVPNRWIVTRMWMPRHDGAGKILSRSWMVESDALCRSSGANQLNEGSATRQQPDDPIQPYRYLGRKYLLGTTPGEPDGRVSPLTAVDGGNPVFTAFYPGCLNVFGMYDSMEDGQGGVLKNVDVCYSVVGWYGNEADDPLRRVGAARECAGKFGWAPPDSAVFPCGLVCQGMLAGLAWEDAATDYTEGFPQRLPAPKLAMGNTSAEALAALTARSDGENACDGRNARMTEHLLAGNHTLYATTDGIADAENRLHKLRFGVSGRARAYAVKPANASVQDSIPMPDALAALNRDLAEEVSLSAELETLTQDAYDAWAAFIRLGREPRTRRVQTLREQCRQKITGLQEKARWKRTETLALRQRIKKAEANLPPPPENFAFEHAGEERYFEPLGIVLLLAGIERDRSHGEDGRFSTEGLLQTRTGTVTALTIDPASGLLDVAASVSPEAMVEKMPQAGKGVANLAGEAALLNPGFAPAIARILLRQAGKNPDPESVSRLAAAIQKLQIAPAALQAAKDVALETLAAAAGFLGPFPSKVAVEYYSHPWLPLYMDWQGLYYPDPALLAEQPDLRNWARRGNDFVYTGETVTTEQKRAVSGRILITPHAASQVAARSEEAVGSSMGAEDMKVLSQTLNGLHEQLVLQELKLQFPIFDLPPPRGEPELAARVAEIVGELRPVLPLFNRLFTPVRGGFLELTSLGVIDAFGQYQAIETNGVAVSENLRSSSGTFQRLAMLPPRVLQPMRLDFRWENPEQPVAGWLMPSRMENNLLVYDGTGCLLGSLQRVENCVDPVVWKAPPEQGGATEPLPAGLHPALDAFLREILRRSRQGHDVLTLFLIWVDEAFWGINPNAAMQAEPLSLYFGRPMALVPAFLKLELQDAPHRFKTLDPDKTPPFPVVDVEKTVFPVLVGQPDNHGDGVLGFFMNRDYSSLKLRGKDIPDDHYTDYHYFSTQEYVPLTPAGQAAPLPVTLLIDPLGDINLDSGILPVKEVRLEPQQVSAALARLYHTVLAAPVLTPGSALRLPFPDVEGRQWTFISYDDLNTWSESAVERADSRPIFDGGANVAREGWLKLRNKT